MFFKMNDVGHLLTYTPLINGLSSNDNANEIYSISYYILFTSPYDKLQDMVK